MLKDNINHVCPVNDDDYHLLETEYDMVNQIICRCKCKPKLEFHHSNYKGYIVGLTVIHNSFDGREAVEWANDILKESDKNK